MQDEGDERDEGDEGDAPSSSCTRPLTSSAASLHPSVVFLPYSMEITPNLGMMAVRWKELAPAPRLAELV